MVIAVKGENLVYYKRGSGEPFTKKEDAANERPDKDTGRRRDAPCCRVVSLCSCPMRWLFGIMANIQDAESRNKADG